MYRPIVLIAGIAFLLHVPWEFLHLPLYRTYEGVSGSLPITLYAALGDVLYTLLAYGAFALLLRDFRWIERAQARHYALLALTGLAVAVFVEYKALLLDRWTYAPEMPLVLGFGLSPLLQMTILLPLTVVITRFMLSALSRRGVGTQ